VAAAAGHRRRAPRSGGPSGDGNDSPMAGGR
jgi:hypothetical protein